MTAPGTRDPKTITDLLSSAANDLIRAADARVAAQHTTGADAIDALTALWTIARRVNVLLRAYERGISEYAESDSEVFFAYRQSHLVVSLNDAERAGYQDSASTLGRSARTAGDLQHQISEVIDALRDVVRDHKQRALRATR